MLRRATNRVQHARDPDAMRNCQGIRSFPRRLVRRLARIEAKIAQHISGDEALAGQSARLHTVPGIGPVPAATLFAQLAGLAETPKTLAPALQQPPEAGFSASEETPAAQRTARRPYGSRPMQPPYRYDRSTGMRAEEEAVP